MSSPVVAVALRWVPWTTTLPLAVAAGGAAFGAGRVARLRRHGAGVLRELGIVLALYSLWNFAGERANLDIGGAAERARWIWAARRWVPLPNELTVQRWVLPHEWLVRFFNVYYAAVHIPSLVALLVWLFVWHRPQYPRIRNVVAIATGTSLLIQLLPVAPPRLTPGLGFVDTAARYGPSVYPAVGQAGPDQLSAMPSVHIAWAALVTLSVATVSRHRARWLVLAHLLLTFVAVVATANHWWLDGIVAIVVLAAAYTIEAAGRVAVERVVALLRRVERAPAVEAAR